MTLTLLSCGGDDVTTTATNDITTTTDDNVTTLPPLDTPKKCVHEEETIVGKEPTITSAGLTDGKKCTLCDEILIYQSIIPAKSVIDGFEYRISDDGTFYSVIGIGNIKDTKAVIPSTYNNLPVTRIEDNAFKNCTTVTEFVITDSVTYIGKSAFESCINLTKVNLPDGITAIKMSAFMHCKSLAEIKLP
ncbi:MAG: leucine-rich repeat domain-containing protein, partial [Clostridia bacterium]|nr:leucine-rich repeat domain-containing protein [Clostridia bacterium]